MARTAFEQRWIDAEPRDGKRGGAFCMSVEGVDESRILANFDGSFDQVSTLAHELGHAYHNHCQRGLPSLLRGAPSTLAETASIFCETLIAEEALAESNPGRATGDSRSPTERGHAGLPRHPLAISFRARRSWSGAARAN